MNNLRLRPKNGDPKKEVQTIEDEYLLLSVEFEAKLFQSENDPTVSYRDLFVEYALKWFNWCNSVVSKFKHVHPDAGMFYEEYHPLV